MYLLDVGVICDSFLPFQVKEWKSTLKRLCNGSGKFYNKKKTRLCTYQCVYPLVYLSCREKTGFCCMQAWFQLFMSQSTICHILVDPVLSSRYCLAQGHNMGTPYSTGLNQSPQSNADGLPRIKRGAGILSY